MRIQLDRNRLFALIGALEDDLRLLIERYLISTHYEEQVLGPAYDKALDRFLKDEERELAETTIVDYLDLGDEIDILNRWRSDLPAETADAMDKLSGRLGGLVPIRNRVSHRRPLLPDDLENAFQVLKALEAEGFSGAFLAEALQSLRGDPDWAPTGPAASTSVRTLNNLPLGDHDQTGLMGRRRELEKLSRQLIALSSGRNPILTIVGPGGVGKTALALQALHDLVNDPACPYDLVSWVSLKTELLTARGIESIRDAVLSVDQALPVMIEALDSRFDGTVEELADALDGLTSLVVIDNLETVSGQEVVDLVDALPDSVSYLFTTREGLGGLGQFPLGSLEKRSAVALLRKLARMNHLEEFASMDQAVAEELVQQLGASPLGLKWFVSGLEMGKEPAELVRNREQLVRFCVENVFESLDQESKAVSSVLHILGRPVTAQELHLYLPEISSDRLRASIQFLIRRMLVHRDLVPGSVSESFESSESLSDYLRVANAIDPDETHRVRATDDANRRAEESHRLDAAYDPLRPNVVQGGEFHKASMLLLRRALAFSRRGDTEQALEQVGEAENLDPEYWEIHRVRGFIMSSVGRVEEATAAYLRAIELAPDSEASAAVKYFYAGHLTRAAQNPSEAVVVVREAHSVLGAARTAVELGRALTYVGEYGAAEDTLTEALEADDVRTRLIAVTQLVECLKRRAESELSVDRQPDLALSTLVGAVERARSALAVGLVDRTLTEKTVRAVSEMFNIAIDCRNAEPTMAGVTVAMSVLEELGAGARRSQAFPNLERRAQRLASSRPELAAAIRAGLSRASDRPTSAIATSGPDNQRHELGSVKVWKPDRHFGFITSLDGGDDFFFDLSTLVERSDEVFLQRGTTIRFVRATSDDGRPQAGDVRVEEFADDSLQGRALRVSRFHISGNCFFSVDQRSGATVFVGRHVVDGGAVWDQIRVGSDLIADIEVSDDGRFSAQPDSVNVVATS